MKGSRQKAESRRQEAESRAGKIKRQKAKGKREKAKQAFNERFDRMEISDLAVDR